LIGTKAVAGKIAKRASSGARFHDVSFVFFRLILADRYDPHPDD
jgi:hypothetical protein